MYMNIKCKKKNVLPDVDDFTGCTLFVLVLHHCETPDSVQQPSAADQVDGTPLLWKLCKWSPPATKMFEVNKVKIQTIVSPDNNSNMAGSKVLLSCRLNTGVKL